VQLSLHTERLLAGVTYCAALEIEECLGAGSTCAGCVDATSGVHSNGVC
jgi:hypothetical protein